MHRLREVWQPRAGTICEPAVGDGAIVAGFDALDTGWLVYDIRATCFTNRWMIEPCDFLSLNDVDPAVSSVCTNPPYSLAEDFVRHSRKLYLNADLVFLLRLGFLASAGRLPLWRDIGAPDVNVLPNRPSFTGNGTDSADYAWFIWPPGKRNEGAMRILAETPAEERKMNRASCKPAEHVVCEHMTPHPLLIE